MQIKQFYEHLPHFWLNFDFAKFWNLNIEDFQNIFNILKLDNMPNLIQKNKGPFNSIKNLVANRHLYIDFENNERKEVNSTYVYYLKIIVMILRLWRKLVITGLNWRLKDNRIEGKFVSKNVMNLSQRQLKVRNFAFFKRT